ncbi:hypothetical protein P1X16_19525 [Hymenobacter sp. YC55]|nr:hypothetical protein [Hymenobacter sp. YC55]
MQRFERDASASLHCAQHDSRPHNVSTRDASTPATPTLNMTGSITTVAH